VKEHPILFKGEMVRAILEDRKTQTRRIPDCRNAKWQVGDRLWIKETFRYYNRMEECICYEDCSCPATGTVIYRASNDTNCGEKWKSSLFMRRSESRILLEITAIREEYLQNITEEDAIKEGIITDEYYADHPGEDGICNCPYCKGLGVHGAFGENYGVTEVDCITCNTPVKRFKILWDSINARRGYSWSDNPIVKVIEFRRLK
jgi:hypothetical protein